LRSSLSPLFHRSVGELDRNAVAKVRDPNRKERVVGLMRAAKMKFGGSYFRIIRIGKAHGQSEEIAVS
jgi:hypothetical protein